MVLLCITYILPHYIKTDNYEYIRSSVPVLNHINITCQFVAGAYTIFIQYRFAFDARQVAFTLHNYRQEQVQSPEQLIQIFRRHSPTHFTALARAPQEYHYILSTHSHSY